MEDLKVGDKLFLVTINSNRKESEWAEITKVGRIYYELSSLRRPKVRKDTMLYIDKNYSYLNFAAYTKEEDYMEEVARAKKQDDIRRFFSRPVTLNESDLMVVHAIISKYG